MPTVPPGNKQIGELTTVVTYGENQSIANHTLEGNAVVLKPNPTTPINVQNKQIGELTTVVTYGETSSIAAHVLSGFAVVHYYIPPPPDYYTLENYVTEGNVVVFDNLEHPYNIIPTEPVQITGISSIATIHSASHVINHVLSGFAVVQEFVPRKELTVFNIEYTADAEFNTVLPPSP